MIPQLQLRRLAVSSPAASQIRQFATSSALRRAFQAGDVVLLREKTTQNGPLVKLRADGVTHGHRGVIKHADIIGNKTRHAVQSSKGTVYRVIEPTLADYVRLTPRLVTPIYPSDANLIVSLLDIHVDTPSAGLNADPPLEILEAGTGHGALTLHLSRAIHAANPPLPKAPNYAASAKDTEDAQNKDQESEDADFNGESLSDLQEMTQETWKKSRRAILHTLDISRKHSVHAKKIVQGWRHGMYAGNVDFHVGDVSGWIASQKVLRKTEEPFLSHVFLDLPGADAHLANVAPALHVNGIVAVFNPSITQIAECVDLIRTQKLPYLLDQIIELGVGNIREWDVRSVRPRASLKKAASPDSPETTETAETTEAAEPSSGEAGDAVKGQEARDGELAEEVAKTEEKWAMICRPKAGSMVVGGGFLALWRRMEHTPRQEAEGEQMKQ